ncbi:inositol 2-dehydrogenase [Paenibacillus azoreducens]|uniref:Oxidoreductase YrbE n=2 Tax=Paenibacillus azoreducens TaxID=116718 RepID=A0A919YAL4_9BACL|nr:inositol 2-dehydrogenase [Paenibacillus azoreducens]GIO45603.1 putative oxidoreductase YrbE [Paenibacillus azoreducens]
MNKIVISLIGFGRIGRVHLKHLLENKRYSIKHVCDIRPAEDFEQQYPNIKYVQDYRKVLCDEEVDAVLICMPASLQPEMIKEAAQANKHILCEKPIGSDLDKIMEAYAEVKKRNIIFQLGFNRRFDEDFLSIKRQIDKIGVPHVLKITSRDPEAPGLDYVKNSGGLFMDMAIHDFDMARNMFGEIEEVYVNGARLINPDYAEYGDIDTAITTLKFANGAIGVIDNSRQAAYGYDQRLEVFGSEGMLQNANHCDHNTVFTSNNGVQSEKPQYFFLQRYMKSYETEANFFADSIQHGAEVVCTIVDAIMAVKVAKAAQQSLVSGKPVKVEKMTD